MIRKKIHLLILILIPYTLIAQHIDKGTFLIGGASNINVLGSGFDVMSINYTTYSYSTYNYTKKSINFSPKIGYFITNKLSVGADFNIAFIKTDYYNEPITKTFLGISPWVRYYLFKRKILPFVEVNGIVGRIKTSGWSGNSLTSDNKRGIMGLGGGIGFSKPLGERLIFDLSLTYTSSKDFVINEDDYIMKSSLGVKFGFNILLGEKSNSDQ